MALRVKAMVAKSEDFCLILRAHMVKENSQELCSCFHTYGTSYICTRTCIHTYKKMKIKAGGLSLSRVLGRGGKEEGGL